MSRQDAVEEPFPSPEDRAAQDSLTLKHDSLAADQHSSAADQSSLTALLLPPEQDEAQVLLIDEPFASVDVRTASLLLQTLRGALTEGRTRLVVSSHPPLLVAADVVIHLSAGRIFAVGATTCQQVQVYVTSNRLPSECSFVSEPYGSFRCVHLSADHTVAVCAIIWQQIVPLPSGCSPDS